MEQDDAGGRMGASAMTRSRKSEGDGSNQYQSKGGHALAKAHPTVTYNGKQQGWGTMPDQELFTDSRHGSTFAVRADKLSPATLAAAIRRKAKEFGIELPSGGTNREVASIVVYSCSVLEGGPGSGIRSHINPSLTAEARSAYEGDGSNQYRRKGGSGRSKFAPDAHEPDEGVRVETPAVRAARIRSMKVDPVRAQTIRKALGMPVRASLA